ncbi:MAG TPA: type IV pilus secretin PilQ [Vicinamibacterales bacterium]|nr:type IV pilus secretin PilQ [Vicinamibacterales bacterium]
MIAIREGKGPRARLARSAGRVMTAVAVVAAAGIMLDAAAPVRLVAVTAQGDAVLIESTEPAAYSVSRPDSLTVVIDMRNVSVSEAKSDVPRQGAIAGVRLEQATTTDGRSLGRVLVALTRPSEHVVRSSRNTIRLELVPRAGAAPRAAAPPLTNASYTVPATPASTPVLKPKPSAASARPQAVEIEKPKAASTVATVLERIQSRTSAAATMITLSGNGRLAPSAMIESKDRPRRLVLDFPNVSSKAPTQTPIDSPLVTRVRVGLNSHQPLVTRVVMEVANTANYHVQRAGEDGRDLEVVFEPSTVPAPIIVAPAEPVAAPVEPEPAITMAQAMANVASILPKDPAGEPAAPDAMAALKTAPLERTVTPPARIEPKSEPAPARSSSPASGRVTPTAPAGETRQPQQQARAAAIPALLQQQQTPPAAPPPAAQPPATPAPQPPATPAGPRPGDQPRQYTGHTISLDFEGVDLRAVLRTFADVSGLNMVIDPDVQGTVDIKLTDVPWDQALDVILRGNQLDYSVDGTIVRISRIKTLEDENKARQSAAQAAAERAAQAGGLTFETFPLSYAKAVEMAPLLKGSLRLSRYGQVQIDARTNTLIIADLPEQFPAIRELLRTLDRAEPQVEVEARIVQTTRDFAKAIGVQWGLNGRVMPDVGNTTPLAFPNQGTLGGRLGGTQGSTDPRSTDLEQLSRGVNLGVPDATSAVGLALGAVNGAFNLDIALSALERSGKGRVLSTPRLTTQNNIEAEVAQGVQIPIQTVANETVTVTFKDAVLTLRVTPQITAAGTVIMKISIENATADFSRQVNGIPPVNTQRANTQVQINDGATTVIGGIFVSTETSSNGQVPGLHRIPLLGWLFKNERVEDESRELLIFITPRILKG